MNDLTIIVGVHKDCPVTQFHLHELRRNTKGSVVPVAFDGTEVTALKVPGPPNVPGLAWWHSDRMLYGGMKALPKSSRYLWLEWDTLCNFSVEKLYENVWDSQIGVVEIITRKSDPDWGWFNWLKKDKGFDFNDSTWGVRPSCGTFFSGEALKAIVEEQSKPKYEELFAEIRIGEAARALGIIPDLISLPKGKMNYGLVHVDGPGIWHSVKTR